MNSILEKIPRKNHENLLVGFESSDDAAVIRLSDDLAIVQTIDFFPAMVSDPYVFGKIGATNALSDIYAMGGEVISALNIVCFPEVDDPQILAEILRGGAEKVMEAGGILAGGHSIHDTSIKYGLSVNGKVNPQKILKNNACEVGDVLILTKPLGVGIITTAYNNGVVGEEVLQEAIISMETLNKYAAEIAREFPIHGCTDITGFGLLGHLAEMLDEKYTAIVQSNKVPILPEAYQAAKKDMVTGGGTRNRNHLGEQVRFMLDDWAMEEVLLDPQTSGGLLISLPVDEAEELLMKLNQLEMKSACIGRIVEKQDVGIVVE